MKTWKDECHRGRQETNRGQRRTNEDLERRMPQGQAGDIRIKTEDREGPMKTWKDECHRGRQETSDIITQ
jgi:hypothetical protein